MKTSLKQVSEQLKALYNQRYYQIMVYNPEEGQSAIIEDGVPIEDVIVMAKNTKSDVWKHFMFASLENKWEKVIGFSDRNNKGGRCYE